MSETVQETEPSTEIAASASANFGSISSQSAHKGVVAKLWKVVKENGQEVSRTEVNTSKYAMSPKKYVVGTANASPEAMAELEAAIAGQNIDAVKAVIGKYGTVNNSAESPTQGDDMAEGAVAPDAQAPADAAAQPADGAQAPTENTPADTAVQPADPAAGQEQPVQ